MLMIMQDSSTKGSYYALFCILHVCLIGHCIATRASDSGARGRGFDPHLGRRVVSLSKIH